MMNRNTSKQTRRTRLVVGALVALAASCSPSPANNSAAEPDTELVRMRRQVLSSIGEHVILKSLEDFEQKATALESAAQKWSESNDPADREAAQQAWRDAMESWQHAEVFQVGPAGIMADVAGGEDLRDEIYSWPLVNPCRVDQELVSKGYEDSAAFSQQLINVRGLDALEYVLFVDGTENACKANSTINSDGSWAALDAATLDERRADYAAAAAKDLGAHASKLADHWRADGQNFLAEFSTAGNGSDTYRTSQEALNALTDALFYVEKETKDMKLAIPVGISDCETETCPDALESQWANFSKEQARANMIALEAAYLGNYPGEAEQQGFDDLLVELGEESLDAEMRSRIGAALQAIDAIDGPMGQALEQDPASVEAAYTAYKAVGDLLKTQFIGALDLELPQRAEGDND